MPLDREHVTRAVLRVRWVNVIARTTRDLALLGAGLLAFVDLPPSVANLGARGLVGAIWATLLAGGALISLLGVIGGVFSTAPCDRKRRGLFELLEIVGCSGVAAGFALWTIAAVRQPDANAVTWAVALVFLSGVAGQVYRVEMIANGMVRR